MLHDAMMTDADLPRVGEVLRSKYELLRTLGEGGMSVVFEGRRLGGGTGAGERVAVKVLAPEFAHEPEIVTRFDREARAVSQLRSRHVVKVLEVDTTDTGLPFIVMDFLDGRDLCAELEQRKTLPIDEGVDYLLQTCAAMDEAHRAGIVHRDLKPANLFVTNIAGARVIKVLDFGISKLVNESAKLTGAGSIMGTVIYMSPEQIHSSTDVDQRADIWSLGVILFELLAGRVPFEGPGHSIAIAIVSDDAPDVRTFAPHVPEPIAVAIASMLRRERNTRFKNTREVIAALAPFAKPDSIGAEVAASLLAKATLPTRNASAGKTLPLSLLQRKTMPLSPSHARPKPAPSSDPSSARTPAAPTSAPRPPQPSVSHASTDMVAAAERSARAAKTVDSRRRNGISLPAVLAGAALGVVAAALVIGVVLLMASYGSPQKTVPSASARRSPPALPTPTPTPSPSPTQTVPSSLSLVPSTERMAIPSFPTTPTAASTHASRTDAGVTPPAPTTTQTNPTLL